ncbi:MAG: SH3 domain-containing protein [Candidatus Promineifilaceae bacterium]|nr:SH3 domain-containing protein [Candidatus Promineifilaceae bacterium]
MIRHRALLVLIATLILTSLACNAFAGNRPSTIAPPPTSDAEANGSTPNSPEELAPTATLPAQVQGSSAKVTMLVDLNVRSGPGVNYDRVGFLLQGEEVAVIGVHEESGWWQIECPENVDKESCWVSGGTEYTEADGVESVEVVEAPPTPTPVPPEIEEGVGITAYLSDGFIHVLRLDLTQDPPRSLTVPNQVSDVGDVSSLEISPDGRRIAFLSGTGEANDLYVVNTDGQDLRRLVSSEELPVSRDQNAAEFTALVDQFAWLSDSKTVLFNTSVITGMGIGGGSQEDLWSVDLDGNMQERLPAGEGGGEFVVTADNRLLLSRFNQIARANLDGTDMEVVLQFELINTASEFIFYPLPQIIDGQANVAIPDQEPFLPGAQTVLWQILPQGVAGQLGVIEGASLFDPIMWSGDESHLVYVQHDNDPDASQPSRLVIADGKGINPDAYAAGDRLVFHAWSNDNVSFLYSGNGFYTVGKLNAPPVQTVLGSGLVVDEAQWITDTAFVAAVDTIESGVWELRSADQTGSDVDLAEMRNSSAVFDIWPVP